MWMGGLILTNTMIWLYFPAQQNVDNYSQGVSYFLVVFLKIFFVIGINMLLLPALFGNKDFFHHFFGMELWNPLARITYSMYMIHYFLI